MKKSYSMKKSLILMNVLLFLIAGIVNGQTITQTNTQFPNPGFEKWSRHVSASYSGSDTSQKWVPFSWHTFDEASCSLWIGCGTAQNNHHNSVNYKNSTMQQFSGSGANNTKHIGIKCTNVLGVKANGALSTGQTEVGSMTATDASNYNYSSSEGSLYSSSVQKRWPFVGCPDSMAFYYYTNISNSSVQPLFKVYLHESGEFRDRANGTLWGGSTTRLIASSVDTFNQAGSSSSWKRETHPFSYSHPGTQTGTYNSSTHQTTYAYTFIGQTDQPTHPTYGYYTTLNRPAYMLASFSTDKTAGYSNQTNGDLLYIDELWCIYDKGLASVSIGGTANTTALNTFNAAEFATHEPSRTYDANGNPIFDNSGSVTWNYPTAIPCNNIPQVTATPKSKLVSQFTIMQATAATGYKAHIFVKHNDNSTFDYYIQFTPALPTITLNDGGTYTACEGDSITVTASGASTYSWSNELGSNATVYPTAAGSYTVTGTASNGCTNTATATVTINTRPSVNITGPASLCQGTTGTLTATGSFVSCTWDDNSTNATRNITPMNAGSATYNVTVTGSNSCTNSTSTTVNVMANPSITTVSANTPCTGYDLILNAETETEGVIFAWSGPNDFTSNDQNPTIGDASTTMNGDYTVTVTDTATECSATDTVTVTVNQPTTSDTTATACESFDWYNHSNITESCSNLTHTLAGANINGCDSIVTLLLTIKYGTYNAETDSAYESFTWHDSTYSTSGIYTYDYINADGCASTDTLHLTINNGTQNAETVITLNTGTTWVSFDVDITLADLKAALVAAAPNTTIKINGQSNSTTYNPNNHRWSGNLAWDLSKMYKIIVTTDCEITLEGTPIDPADHPVTIVNGNNYLGFPLNENMSLTNAFAGFAANGDKILSQTGSATYTRGRWQGSTLTELQPGKGYTYKSASSESRTFVFPNSAR